MTSDKAQKQAIRARMAKTGERYTAARRHLLDHPLHPTPEPTPDTEPSVTQSSVLSPQSSSLPPRVAEPGMSDAAVQRATGKVWDEWFALLDAWGAAARSHYEIARYLATEQQVGDWWAQMVTVGYERARGLRAVNQKADGFVAGASKTFPVSAERLFAAFVDEAMRDAWLEPGTLRLRTSQPNRSARFDVLLPPGGTLMHIYLTAKGPAKTSVQLQHEKLASEADVATWRALWKERLERLAGWMNDG